MKKFGLLVLIIFGLLTGCEDVAFTIDVSSNDATVEVHSEEPDWNDYVILSESNTEVLESIEVDASVVDLSTVGDYTVDYTYTDTSGVLQSDSFVVHVVDTIAPLLSTLNDTEITLGLNEEYVDPEFTIEDNYDTNLNADSISVNSNLDTSNLGTYEVEYSVEDSEGNISEPVVITVHVVDLEIPIIELIGEEELFIEVNSIFEDPGSIVSDNIDENLTAIVTGTVDTSILGDYELKYNVEDANGNVAIEKYRVIHVVDNTSPEIELNGSNVMVLEMNSEFVDPFVSVLDNYDDMENLTTVTEGEVDSSVVGEYILTYHVVDTSENESESIFRRVFIVDHVVPSIQLNGEEYITLEFGQEYIEENAYFVNENSYQEIFQTDSIDESVIGEQVLSYSIIVNEIEYEISRTINIVDTEKPVITMNGEEEVTVEYGTEFIDSGATVLDNYDSEIIATIESTLDESVVGTYTITYSAVDSSGNEATSLTRTVHIVDTEAPVITMSGDEEITLEYGSEYSDLGATAIDNYDSNSTVTTEGFVDDTTVGTYTITYSAIDSSGNLATSKTRTIHIVDTITPTLTINSDSEFDVEYDSDYIQPTITCTDNYDGELEATITGEVNTSVLDTYVITVTCVDSSNNETTEDLIVHVVDTIAPVITMAGEEDVYVEYGTTYIDSGATVTDNHDENIVVSIESTLDETKLGDYTITYSAIDSSGNSAITLTRNIHIIDTTPPTTVLKTEQLFYKLVPTDLFELVTVSDNYSLDEDYTVSYEIVTENNVTVSSIDDVGTYIIRFTTIDSLGNEGTTEVTFIALDFIDVYSNFEDIIVSDRSQFGDFHPTNGEAFEIIVVEDDDMIICYSDKIEYVDGTQGTIEWVSSASAEIRDCYYDGSDIKVLSKVVGAAMTSLKILDIDGNKTYENGFGGGGTIVDLRFTENGNILYSIINNQNKVWFSLRNDQMVEIGSYETANPLPSGNFVFGDMLEVAGNTYITYSMSGNSYQRVIKLDAGYNLTAEYSSTDTYYPTFVLEKYNDEIVLLKGDGIVVFDQVLNVVREFDYGCNTTSVDGAIIDDELFITAWTGGNSCAFLEAVESKLLYIYKVDLETLELIDKTYIEDRFNNFYTSVDNEKFFIIGYFFDQYGAGYYELEPSELFDIDKRRLELVVNSSINELDMAILKSFGTPIELLHYETNADPTIPGAYPIELYVYIDEIVYRYDTTLYVVTGDAPPVIDCGDIEKLVLDSTVDLDNIPLTCTATDTLDGDVTSSITYTLEQVNTAGMRDASKVIYLITIYALDSGFNESTLELVLEVVPDIEDTNYSFLEMYEVDNPIIDFIRYEDQALEDVYYYGITNDSGDGLVIKYDEKFNLISTTVIPGTELIQIEVIDDQYFVISTSKDTTDIFSLMSITPSSAIQLNNNLLILDYDMTINNDSHYYEISYSFDYFDVAEEIFIVKADSTIQVFDYTGETDEETTITLAEYSAYYNYIYYNDAIYVAGILEDDGNHGIYQGESYISIQSAITKFNLDGTISWSKVTSNDGHIAGINIINDMLMISFGGAYFDDAFIDDVEIGRGHAMIFISTDGTLLHIEPYYTHLWDNNVTIEPNHLTNGTGELVYVTKDNDYSITEHKIIDKRNLKYLMIRQDAIYFEYYENYEKSPIFDIEGDYIFIKHILPRISLDTSQSTSSYADLVVSTTINYPDYTLDLLEYENDGTKVSYFVEIIMNDTKYLKYFEFELI